MIGGSKPGKGVFRRDLDLARPIIADGVCEVSYTKKPRNQLVEVSCLVKIPAAHQVTEGHDEL